ncbi:MAG: nucleoside deaminase [Methylococcaceae bacterium]
MRLARQAEAQGEVPVGALLVTRRAGTALRNYRLPDTTLYVTLEPCAMCMTALVHARIKRLVFGADDPERGAVVSALQLAEAEFLNHRVEYQGGIMAEECSEMLNTFFRMKRTGTQTHAY